MFIVVYLFGAYFAFGFGLQWYEVVLKHVAPRAIKDDRIASRITINRPLRLPSTYG